MNRLLYSVTEAAEKLSVSKRTAQDLIREGELESVKIGARRLVPHESLLSYIERLRRAA